MKCPTELFCSSYVDGALPDEETRQFDEHLGGCRSCQQRLSALSVEVESLRSALRESVQQPTVAERELEFVPDFAAPLSVYQLLLWLVGLALGTVLISAAWSKLLALIVLPSWLEWLIPNLTGIGVASISYITNLMTNGGELMDKLMHATIYGALIGVALCFFLHRTSKQVAPMCFALLTTAAMLGQTPEAQALDLRHHDDRVAIEATEMIDDTLIVAADIVVVEGEVTGDLIALGEKVVLRGKVGGNILVFGERLELEVDAGGSIFTAGESVDLREGSFGGNLYVAGEKVTVRPEVSIAGNIFLASEDGEVHGSIGRDLIAAAEELTLLGKVEKSMLFYGKALELTDSAHIEGNLTARLADNSNLTISDAATIGGEQDVNKMEQEEAEEESSDNPFFAQLMKFLAALLFGLALFWLLPSLRFTGAASGPQLLTSSAFGAVFLVATPILAIICMVTLIGLPIGLAALLLWVIALYASGIVAAAFVGDSILQSGEHSWIVTLVVGLLIVYVLLMIPYVGTLTRIVALLLGLGLIMRWARNTWGDATREQRALELPGSYD